MALRLNKFLAERLGISRREADNLIAAGKVTLNGETAQLGAQIRGELDNSDEICYNSKIIPFRTDFTYLALNKPVGYVCSRKQQGQAETVYALLPKKYQKLKTVGRLDKNSSGLILLTDDGDFIYRMTHPKFRKMKIYEVELDAELAPLHQQMIADYGIEIGDGVSRLGLAKLGHAVGEKSKSRDTDDRRLWRVEMSEGRNRQIRRTFAALGYTVVALHRVQFGPYRLEDLKPGEWTKLPAPKDKRLEK